jgi:hypothetical protein
MSNEKSPILLPFCGQHYSKPATYSMRMPAIARAMTNC